MKTMIKCWVKNILTNVSYYQEEGLNYPHWTCSKEEVRYKPNPKDYESDDSVSWDHEKAVKNHNNFIKWNSHIFPSFFSTWLWKVYPFIDL